MDLFDWVGEFCRVRRTEPWKLVLDEISPEFCLVFDFKEDPRDASVKGNL